MIIATSPPTSEVFFFENVNKEVGLFNFQLQKMVKLARLEGIRSGRGAAGRAVAFHVDEDIFVVTLT